MPAAVTLAGIPSPPTAFGPLFGLLFGPLFGLLFGPLFGLLFGPLCGALLGLLFGPLAGRSLAGLLCCAAGRQATVTEASRYTSWMALSSSTPSAMGRWKALRPEIRPVPPARLLITAVATASARSLAPEEAPPLLIRPTRPM